MCRRADAAKRVSRDIRASLDGRAMLLTTPAAVNWRTGGLSDPIDLTSSSDPAWVIDTDHGSALITNEIEAPRFEYDFRVTDMGFELLAGPWFDDDARLRLASEYANVAPPALVSDRTDIGLDVRHVLTSARLALGDAEQDDLRDLGALAGAALGAGMDVWRPGVSNDYDSAAVISAVLGAEGATAVCLIVGGDERLRTFRHPLAVGAVVHDALMAVVVARRAGLHVAATRFSARSIDDEILTLMKTLEVIHDTVLAESLPGGTWGDTMTTLAGAYDDAGYRDAWREHFQGGPIGFEQREFEIAPTQRDSPYWSLQRQRGSAVAWNPSLRGGAKIEETYLVGNSLELLTTTPGWPLVEGPLGVPRSAVKVV